MPVNIRYFPYNPYPVVIIGTDEDNNIVGTYLNDAIDGRRGHDEISGLGGNDAISGNEGDDTINGNEGNDFLIGHEGNDIISGGSGNDFIVGFDPTSGFGASEQDILRGDAGADTFVLGDKHDVYYVDYYDYDTSSVGEQDYGLIVDFIPSEDRIELNGTQDDYLLDFYTTSDGTVTADIVYDPGIAARGDLIGILEDVSADLKLTDSSFVYGENDYAVLYNRIFAPLEQLEPGTYYSAGIYYSNDTTYAALDLTRRQDFVDPPILYNPPSSWGDWGDNGTAIGIISDPIVPIPPNIIEGTSDDDVLNGTENRDIIYGYEGNDHLSGLGDDDTIFGGEGEDTITGGEGNDSLEGEDDNDTIYGGTGEDTIVGGEGNDSLEGEEDDDVITGDGGNDVIWGGSGNDHLHGGSDDDHITGGTGEDTITGGEGDDTVTGGEGNDSLDGGEDDDVITGEGSHDDLSGGLGDDTIYGGLGDDTIYGDVYYDDYVYNNSYLSDVGGDDTIYGGLGDDTIYGDVYYDDYVYGDEPVYNSGNDLIAGESGNDYLDGGLGDDTIYGGTGDDTIYGGGEDDSLEGGENDDNIYGSDGNDVIAGDSGDDDLDGGLGDDTISGGTGDDTIFGEENFFGYGTDIYFFQSYSVSYDPYQEFYNVGNDSIEGDNGNDVIFGGLGDDTISGGTGDDTIFGDIYNLYYEEDYEEDYNGNDSIEGDSGNDYLLGRLGDDTISGGTGDDTIFGETGNDIISGGTGDDTIFGETGNDIISGTTSDSEEIDEIDELTGGLGSDRFILGDEIGVYYDDGDPMSLGESDFALITDFNADQDFIQLHGPREFYYLDFYEYYDDYEYDDRFIGAALMYDPGVTARRELIGIIHNVAEDLTLEDVSFIFVGDQDVPEPTINANLENNDVPPPIINQAPADITLTFNQPDTIYHPKDDLILQGNVFDANGAEDLSYVEIYLQYPNQAVVPLEKITEFDDQGNFNQELDLEGYAHGNYVFWMQATDQQGLKSEWFSTSFSINNEAPDSLTLELDSDSYHPSETLTLSGLAND
nr:calcium-binding protein [Crocosphaera sp.]